MQTQLSASIKDTLAGQRADEILRKCVHCGFCNATCPTYSILGNELDGPRGRIYLIKQMLEGSPATSKTQLHLDRCLTCLNCETTCPSGVKYGQLLDIGRELADEQVSRPAKEKFLRFLLRKVLPYPARFGPLLKAAQIFRPLLPEKLKQKIPHRAPASRMLARTNARNMLILEGCVQASLTPEVNNAARRVLDAIGISITASPQAGCCGALSFHLGETEEAQAFMKRNIDAWWPDIQAGAEALVVTASGCGQFIKQYGDILVQDSEYSSKALHISEACRDICEVIDMTDLKPLTVNTEQRIAWHCPCTLQHGQKLGGRVEAILESVGYTLTKVNDTHMCCGSAGTYSILQPELSGNLLENKLSNLEKDSPDVIATANIGCQMHLQSQSRKPVRHWIELLDV